jgi:serine phosphatase RsbU (regulator of sigma subunit)
MPPPDDERFERTTILSRQQIADALAARDHTGHYLVVAGAAPGAHVEIGATPVTIGRDPQKVLSFNDTDLSRFHLRVSLIGDAAVAEDMGSTNGTLVNHVPITAPHVLQHGDVIRAGRQQFRYERLSRRDVERAHQMEHDLAVAGSYVRALLPAPLTSGPVHTTWHFVPSMQLGGDAFGYRWLDDTTFVFYLIDVSGHGAGSAMHSATVVNLLRQQALPGVDFRTPADVLSNLNVRFQMEHHGGLFFTMWYGVYRTVDRTLTFSTAGHHPAYLVSADRQAARPLGTEALMIGAMDDTTYQTQQAFVPAGSALYLFSDGAFEVDTLAGDMWRLKDFVPLLTAPTHPDTPEPVRLYRTVAAAAGRDPLADDFSLMMLTFA